MGGNPLLFGDNNTHVHERVGLLASSSPVLRSARFSETAQSLHFFNQLALFVSIGELPIRRVYTNMHRLRCGFPHALFSSTPNIAGGSLLLLTYGFLLTQLKKP
ncbi:hypothetical protein M404DRAFT_996773, partial [Pisolithus tinctorius Marx 270]